MGVEGNNLYTADVTRTLPVDGTYTPLQRDLYSVVLEAQQAGIDAVRPGADFQEPHQAAMRVIVSALDDLGLLPVSAEEALAPDNKTYTRWTLHSTSHMLGLDVHDCAAASAETYKHGPLKEGMVLTVEPASTSRRTTCSSPTAARHRHPHRGRHRRDRRRVGEPVGGPSP